MLNRNAVKKDDKRGRGVEDGLRVGYLELEERSIELKSCLGFLLFYRLK